ncbi:sensor histidine kinase [Streptomyces liliifuscus]|uniref:histidine kinase n=1 Tax=Streptomyces liliifuscus TaxID=2797636 RepID=A0A7T7I5R9_9ACTN|nr:sensor histidine kinase [Streptomyces liliifuscus]QQM41515.1 sensor domain-containing protein [Streptomyces liliifuscus]
MRKTTRQAAGATVQLAGAAVLTFGTMLFLTVLLITATATLAVVGAGLLPETVTLVRRIAGAKRRQVTRWTGERIPEAYLPLDDGPLRARLRTAVHDPGTLMDLRWMFAEYGYGSVLPILVLPLWPAALLVDGVRCGLLNREPLVLPLIIRLADLEASWSTALLRPSPRARLSERVEELTATRAGVVAAHEAELRRIEQDLQDGTQARLVSLSMRLGLAKRAYERDPAAARKLLDDAQDQAEEALTELRHVVRGIHPPILTDRGLAGAVRALAASSGLDVTVDTGDLESSPRAPAGVEAAAYFTVAEALANAAKHSGSNRASVRLARVATGLTVTVSDEGHGGADETTGSGLLGMRRRIAALDGTVRLTSPTGGPTVIEAGLPCGW